MRKKNCVIFFIVAILSVPIFSWSAEKAGGVVSVRGTAFIERNEEMTKADMGNDIFVEDMVTTKSESRIKMLFRDDSILTLGASSKLVVRQYLFSPENKRADSIFEILDGKLRSLVGKGEFKVKTPTALVAARGTTFTVWYEPSTRSTGILVTEGTVEVRSSNRNIAEIVVVEKGSMTYVTSGEPPQMPKKIKEKDNPLNYPGEINTNEVGEDNTSLLGEGDDDSDNLRRFSDDDDQGEDDDDQGEDDDRNNSGRGRGNK